MTSLILISALGEYTINPSCLLDQFESEVTFYWEKRNANDEGSIIIIPVQFKLKLFILCGSQET